MDEYAACGMFKTPLHFSELLSDEPVSEWFHWVTEQVHGHEVFLTDRFNADPHPGNIVVMADGRLGLIDYGRFPVVSVVQL
jgi:hypothetical protein